MIINWPFRAFPHQEITDVPRDKGKNSENSLMLFHLSPNPQLLPNTLPHMPNTPHQPHNPQPHLKPPIPNHIFQTHTFRHQLLPQTSPTYSSHTSQSHPSTTSNVPTSDTIIPTPKEPLYSQSFNPIIFHPNNPHPFRRKIPCEKTSKKRGFTPSYYHPWIPSTLT